ncbi:hypothetical protein BDV30DRAFT_213163 [Aspergillus minisclerotigenes]|uniref:Uncharacterized protein n=1 Tax=Aspergillus minisclerotigenes TaxID=656917 RepID=A0A5N6IYV8_9EURO|nr:hypothetical protein BDV30DRAFT_213163 [Aspergillus minisclerotigenes]
MISWTGVCENPAPIDAATTMAEPMHRSGLRSQALPPRMCTRKGQRMLDHAL